MVSNAAVESSQVANRRQDSFRFNHHATMKHQDRMSSKQQIFKSECSSSTSQTKGDHTHATIAETFSVSSEDNVTRKLSVLHDSAHETNHRPIPHGIDQKHTMQVQSGLSTFTSDASLHTLSVSSEGDISPLHDPVPSTDNRSFRSDDPNASLQTQSGHSTFSSDIPSHTFSSSSEDNSTRTLSLIDECSRNSNNGSLRNSDEDTSQIHSDFPTSFSGTSSDTSCNQSLSPKAPRRSSMYNCPARPLPLGPDETVSASFSVDSWDDMYESTRDISLLDIDTTESHDDEEEDGYGSGGEGDDECERHVDLNKMQSHDSLSPPSINSFRGSLPKFGRSQLSNLRSSSQRGWMPELSRSRRSLNRRSHSSRSVVSRRGYIKCVERAEEEKKNQICKNQQKGLFQAFKDMIYCIPGTGTQK